MTRLQRAVWKAWLQRARGAMGSGTPHDVVKEYGFTGPFAGLANGEIQTLTDLRDALEEAIEWADSGEYRARRDREG